MEDQKTLITKRFQTTMIGALHEFEKAFGHLWGHDKNEDFLTESEEEFMYRWENVRNQILNNGNNQLRKCLSDLERTNNQHNNTYHYKFYNRNRNRGN